MNVDKHFSGCMIQVDAARRSIHPNNLLLQSFKPKPPSRGHAGGPRRKPGASSYAGQTSRRSQADRLGQQRLRGVRRQGGTSVAQGDPALRRPTHQGGDEKRPARTGFLGSRTGAAADSGAKAAFGAGSNLKAD